MFGLDFASYPLAINLALFGAAAVIVWFVGGRVATVADVISDKTGLGSAFVGVVFLAVATSSPELSTTVTASLRDQGILALNNLFGAIAMQTAILAVVDALIVRGALTAFTPRPVLMLQGVLLILLLSLALSGAISGLSLSLWGIGFWPLLILVVYVVVLYLVQRYEGRERWQPIENDPDDAERERMQEAEAENRQRSEEAVAAQETYREWSVRNLSLYFAGGTLVIMAAGSFLAANGEALAEQTGLGSSFVGVTLLAIATSLPEVSATITAARIGRLEMAVSNIFGSNAFMLGLLVVADLAYRHGDIMTVFDQPSLFAIAAGILVTAVYLAGMIERRDYTIFGMGIDSLAVIGVYAGSLVILYLIR